MDLTLTKPAGATPLAWAAIEMHLGRLQAAHALGDPPAILGCAKELLEAVAKLAILERGETPSERADMPALVNTAHVVLDRQPGPGLADDPGLRELMQGAKKIALSINELRNQLGTGHGRLSLPAVQQEVIDVVVPGAMLWCHWALGRLAHLIAGSPNGLIRDLAQGETFTSGSLRQRLLQANLRDLPDLGQQRIGAAVARRAMGGTFVVASDGVQSCAVDRDLGRWPAGYRRGLAEGLLASEDGAIHLDAWGAQMLASVLQPIPRLADEVGRLIEIVGDVPPTSQRDPYGYQRTREVEAALGWSASAISAADPGAAAGWDHLIRWFAP
jgi:hypothetical protein